MSIEYTPHAQANFAKEVTQSHIRIAEFHVKTVKLFDSISMLFSEMNKIN